MKRSNFVVVLGSATVAAAVLVVLFRPGSSPLLGPEDAAEYESLSSSSSNGSDEPPLDIPTVPSTRDRNEAVQDSSDAPRLTEAYVRRRAPPDETTVREQVRQSTTEDVQRSYSILLEQLDVTESERHALLALLIEIRVAATWTPYSRGKVINKDERADKIAAIIGDAKLQQFLAMERDLYSYAHLRNVESLLQQNGKPLTRSQRDGLLRILVDVRTQYRKPSDDEPGSIEALEDAMVELDEIDRHVMELAPGVLTSNQVVYLFEQYQYQSYQRAVFLERQKKRIAEDPTKNITVFRPSAWID